MAFTIVVVVGYHGHALIFLCLQHDEVIENVTSIGAAAGRGVKEVHKKRPGGLDRASITQQQKELYLEASAFLAFEVAWACVTSPIGAGSVMGSLPPGSPVVTFPDGALATAAASWPALLTMRVPRSEKMPF